MVTMVTTYEGNVMPLGGVYTATPPTLAENGMSPLLMDSLGNAKVTLATAIAGEDTVNDVLKVEERFNYYFINTAATTLVKTGVGFLHGMWIQNPGATSNSIKIYDNTSATGTVIADLSTSGGLPAAGWFPLDVSYSVGLTVVTAGTTPPVLTLSYR